MGFTKQGNPKLIIDLNKLRHNLQQVKKMCEEEGVELAGVIKGCTGLLPCVEQFERAGLRFIASSRIEQLADLRDNGIQTDLFMIRVPMLSEAADVVKYCSYSLNSEEAVLEELNKHAGLQDKVHNVILMADCGDLREGWWDKDEMYEVALRVEKQMHNLHLAGVGFNVGCYGSILATPEKIQELVDIAERIENGIGRELEFISGGATSSLMRIMDKNIPNRVNMLRIGEGILLAYDLEALYGYDTKNLYQDVFTLRAELIEVKDKPSHPVGERGFDAFGHIKEYEDKGIRRKGLLAIGKCDYGDPGELIPRMNGIEVLGASSDHTILDMQELVDAGIDLRVGDVLDFDLNYATMVYLTNTKSVEIIYI